ncbi:MAG: hypothetical protein ACJ71Y_14920 [Blastococcus sp.]
MSATPAPPRRASAPRRLGLAARGLVMGVGLLVAATALAGPALAVPDPDKSTGHPAKPSVPAGGGGNGKPLNFDPDVVIQVRASGPVPGDLDYSGAVFTFTKVHVPTKVHAPHVVASCTTDAAGRCTVVVDFPRSGAVDSAVGPTVHLRPGTYAVRQTSASIGLQSGDADVGTVAFCGVLAICVQSDTVQVTNASLFRTAVVTTVIDSKTAARVPGAGYELTGPNYPHVGSLSAGSADAGTAVSDADGTLEHAGWFLSGSWTLTPSTPPEGYLPDVAHGVAITTSAAEAQQQTPFEVQLLLDPTPGTSGDGGGPVDTTPPGDSDPSGNPDPVAVDPVAVDPVAHPDPVDGPGVPVPPAPVVDPSAGTGTGGAGVAAGGRTAGSPTPGNRSRPGTTTDAVDSDAAASGDAGATPSGPRNPPNAARTAGPPAETLAGQGRPTELTTVSSSFTAVGVIGFGILLVALVVVGTRVVMRRARGRG